jgi:FAD/FMN-containing dehydrogenase
MSGGRVASLEHLRAAARGRVLLPGDGGWAAARRAWQLRVDQQPAAVVEAATAEDVIAAVRAARAGGLRVAPQATGHGAATVPDLGDAILLRTGALTEVRVDAAAGVARVGAGARWSQVAEAADRAGFAAVAGFAPSVGAVGFSLGGGLGWFARSHGLAAEHIVAVEGVDAHGHLVRADADRNSELLWAARGGVLPLIVTALEVQLHRVPTVQAGSLMWPIEQAADVAHAWRAWIGGVPDTVTSLARVLRFPPLEVFPEPVRGRAFVVVEAAIQDADADGILAPLRALRPEMDTVRPMRAADLGTVHGDPVDPSAAYGEAVVLAEISAPAIDAFVEATLAPEAGALLSVELRHLGGRLSPGGDPDGERGAVTSVSGEGLVMALGVVPAPEALEPVRRAAEGLVAHLQPFSSSQVVKNFAERPAPAEAFYGSALARLRDVRSHWDPDGLIATAHPLG